MDYKELAWNCETRAEVYRTLRNEAGAMHEEQCSRAITDLLARAEAAEERAKKAEEIASDLCNDFTDFVTGGVPNAAPYCANCRPECIDGRGWCNGDNRVCKGFLPKAAVVKEE